MFKGKKNNEVKHYTTPPPKPKKKAPLQLIVDNMPKRKIKKENTNIDSIIDDLNLLAKKIR